MPKEKKEPKTKKEKKEKSHKEKKEKHSKNKIKETKEDTILPISVESPVKIKSEDGLIVHYDLRALIPFAQPLASEELTREMMKLVRKGNYISYFLFNKNKLKRIVK